MRLVLEDWSDKYSKMIFKALIPALKHGAKIVINDRVIPRSGEAPYLVEREARSVHPRTRVARETDTEHRSDL